jgi:hypothetical protein
MADSDIIVSGLTVTGGRGTLSTAWVVTPPSPPSPGAALPYLALDHFELWVSATDFTGATKAADVFDLNYTMQGVAGSTTRNFWVCAVDKAGNKSAFYPATTAAGISGTSAGAITSADIVGGIDFTALGTDLAGQMAAFSQASRSLLEQAQELALRAAEQELANYSTTQTLRQEISVAFDSTRADYSSMVLAYAGPTSAVVSRLEELEAITSSGAGSAFSLLQAQVDNIGDDVVINTSALTQVQADLGYDSGSSTFRMNASYTPGAGFLSRIALEVRAGSVFHAAAYLEASNTGSRFVLDSQSTVIANGSTIIAMFQSSGVYLNMAVIKDADITGAKIGTLEVTNAHIDNLTIGVDKVQYKAFTKSDQATSASIQAISSSGEVTLQTLTFTPEGGQLRLRANCMAYMVGSANPFMSFRLRQNGTEVRKFDAAVDDTPITTILIDYIVTSAGTSASTWTLTVDTGSSATMNVLYRTIYATNYKDQR